MQQKITLTSSRINSNTFISFSNINLGIANPSHLMTRTFLLTFIAKVCIAQMNHAKPITSVSANPPV